MTEQKLKTSKEMKSIARPIFAQNYEQYYPVRFLQSRGFLRKTCKCGHNFWTLDKERTVFFFYLFFVFL
jgi:hypothetical protein